MFPSSEFFNKPSRAAEAAWWLSGIVSSQVVKLYSVVDAVIAPKSGENLLVDLQPNKEDKRHLKIVKQCTSNDLILYFELYPPSQDAADNNN
jgi:hypothetical protein